MISYLLFNVGLMIFVLDSISIMPFIFIWNLFLAIIPLICMMVFERLVKTQPNRIYLVLVGILWLLFFPNAMYVVTDLIHLQNGHFYEVFPSVNYSPVETIYFHNIDDWIILIDAIGLYILGTYAGLYSLDKMLMYIKKVPTKWLSLISLPVISLLTAIGIYIGRFLRFNSWDIFQPITLLQNFITSLDGFSIAFVALFTFYILFSYLFYKLIKKT
ncbi:DUF1361 domain-containing protein [Granulicatella balaenopterae]|nr:DUF1361 domain-containing protein [Granulicatella balaenopterae]